MQNDINRHVAARRAYGEALARVTAIEDRNLPTAQIADAHLKAYEAYTEMTEAARMLLVVMPTDLKALSLLLRGRRRVGNKWQSVSFLSNSGECLGAA